MLFDEFLSCMLTDFVTHYVAEERQMTAAEEISTIVAFGLRKTEEGMHRALCEAFEEKLPEVRRCMIDEPTQPSSN